ncbi:hypothetical protein ERO13_D11G175633v2 [Gossypium hirsutum]|uniref:Uncharacterized protein n=3 Tax=Gossypium TaxID=3633 RepID=A0A5D2STZ7_GOSMU|nr:hypothetical protein ES319_D08G256700v1 [Gossypium barbadense]KAG4120969.1 hypothetical protein ERO13_D11G175633v2 [Gossypium hirsutum]TYG45704.1 hypothetical protein ES288_D11G195600v1 [Gossypium darwinii]TYI56162.1 hypothetical protein E1A91_D11G190300v1 [Gossypium mustelinum]TYG51009.1 hypothetical protein ES288_D10G221800v1 [Gossypium darwinii]
MSFRPNKPKKGGIFRTLFGPIPTPRRSPATGFRNRKVLGKVNGCWKDNPDHFGAKPVVLRASSAL